VGGRLGLASAMDQLGDMVCILFGCHGPIVLRPKGEEEYNIVSQCYLDGIMKNNELSLAACLNLLGARLLN
jgi:hypothetical protein